MPDYPQYVRDIIKAAASGDAIAGQVLRYLSSTQDERQVSLAELMADKDVIAIRRKMIAEGRRGPITDADADALLFADRPDILGLFSYERPNR